MMWHTLGGVQNRWICIIIFSEIFGA